MSSTIYQESLMGSLVQDAHEGLKIAIFDIPWEYWNTDMEEYKVIFIKLEDKFLDVVCDIYQTHIPNMWYEKGE